MSTHMRQAKRAQQAGRTLAQGGEGGALQPPFCEEVWQERPSGKREAAPSSFS